MRCLHCGVRISLLRKLKDAEFCSDEHRVVYESRQQKIAVERLIDAREKTPLPPPLPAEKRVARRSRSTVGRGDAIANKLGTSMRYRVAPLDSRGDPFVRVEPEPVEPAGPEVAARREACLNPCRVAAGRVVALTAPEAAGGAAVSRRPGEPDFEPGFALSMPGGAGVAPLAWEPPAEALEPPPDPFETVPLAGTMEWSSEWRGGWQARSPQRPSVQQVDGPAVNEPSWTAAVRREPPHTPALAGAQPSIDLQAAALDAWAARVSFDSPFRLRMPRLRAPRVARQVKPLSGSAALYAARRVVCLPESGLSGPGPVRVPTGTRLNLHLERTVFGNRAMLSIAPEQWPLATPRRAPTNQWTGGSARVAMARPVELPLPNVAGTLVCLRPETKELALRIRPAVSSPLVPVGICAEPPSGRHVPIVATAPRRRPLEDFRCKPPARPVASYRWTVSPPETGFVPEAEWIPARTAHVPLRFEFPYHAMPAVPHAVKAKPEPWPEAPVARGGLTGQSPAQPALPAGLSGCAQHCMRLDGEVEKCVARTGTRQPIPVLEPYGATLKHQLRGSDLRTRALWQASKWSSVYGSAIWRIAVGRFSGALGQAPTFVRWLAFGAAMALAAVAILPTTRPEVPQDRDWVLPQRAQGSPAAGAAARPAAARPAASRRAVPVRPAASKNAARQDGSGEGGGGLTSAWETLQHRISDRAAIAFTDDFRNGLADWEGAGEWARSWSYDAAGFVRTGGLALYAPTREMTDYRMEFLGQIERRSLGWVVRASNLRNYQALKLTILEDGPVPEVALVRYAVVGGAQIAVSQQRLPVDVRSDTVYRVLTEVEGDHISVAVQGKIVDSWAESRLPKGGVGLFSGKGELSRIRWVGVWHQYDTLGRLCALLAPGGLPGRERGEN